MLCPGHARRRRAWSERGGRGGRPAIQQGSAAGSHARRPARWRPAQGQREGEARRWRLGGGGMRRCAASGPFRPRQSRAARGWAARGSGRPSSPGARGGGARARTGAARGAPRRHSAAATAARLRTCGGGAETEGERGRGGRGEREEAHRTLDLGGGWPEVGAGRKGRRSGEDGNGRQRWQARFGCEMAQSSSWSGGVGAG